MGSLASDDRPPILKQERRRAIDNDPFDPADPKSPISLGYGATVAPDGRVPQAIARQRLLDAVVRVEPQSLQDLRGAPLEHARAVTDPNDREALLALFDAVQQWGQRWHLENGSLRAAASFTVMQWANAERAGLPLQDRIEDAPDTWDEASRRLEPNVLPRRETFPDSPYRGLTFAEFAVIIKGGPGPIDPDLITFSLHSYGWNPRRESRIAAEKRILQTVKADLRQQLKDIELSALERGDQATPAKHQANEHFEWLARRIVLRESIQSIAEDVGRGPQAVDEAVRRTAEQVGLRLTKQPRGRPPKFPETPR